MFTFRTCNMESSADLGITFWDILKMLVAKLELGDKISNEQFFMCFV